MLSWVGLAIDAVQGAGVVRRVEPQATDRRPDCNCKTDDAIRRWRRVAGRGARAAAALRAICAVGEISTVEITAREGEGKRGGCSMVVAHSVSGDLMS